MEKVQDMVASIEARVRMKKEEVHVSDVSSSEDEDCEEAPDNDDSQSHVSQASSDEEEYDRARNLDISIHVSDVSSSEDEDEEIDTRALDISQVYSSGSGESLESLFGSPDELPTEFRTYQHRLPTPPASGGTPLVNQQATTRSLMDDMDMEKHITPQSEHQYFDKMQNRPYPQDRSVASKMSAFSGGSSSKLSAISSATPLQPYIAQPVVSPPFSLLSPAGTRAGIRIKTPATDSKVYKNSIQSPPKVKTTSKSARKSRKSRSTLYDMKQEIDDLTSQFATLEKESRQRRARFDLAPEDRLDESLNVMGQKADAMADALHRNYARSDQLQRDNDALKEHVRNLKTRSPNKEETAVRKKKVHKTPETLLRELDSSDDYVKRQYPSVPKTPGTMFATELVEVMGLEVGDHAYLAEVMDRQWRTKRDYRP